MGKLKAFGIHVGISSALFLLLLFFIIIHWYPVPYFSADGGWQGIRLIFLVDVVLGPLLTLLVYKRGKPGLKFDMTLIALAQVVALSWGTWTVYSQRTMAVVFVDDAFHTLNPQQLEQAGLDESDLAQFPHDPPMAFLRLPEDKQERKKLIREYELKKNTPVIRLGERYEPLNATHMQTIMSRVNIIDDLRFYNPDFDAVVTRLLKKYGGTLDDYVLVPIHARYRHSVMLIRRDDGRVLTMSELTIPSFY